MMSAFCAVTDDDEVNIIMPLTLDELNTFRGQEITQLCTWVLLYLIPSYDGHSS